MTPDTGGACIANIGPRQQRRRRISGFVALAAAAVLAAGLVAAGTPRAWRLLVFVPALGGALGLLQVRSQTCVFLAAQGRRNMDEGAVAIADAAEQRTVSAQARRVALQSVLAAAAITAGVLLI